jgi:hypothetical protein
MVIHRSTLGDERVLETALGKVELGAVVSNLAEGTVLATSLGLVVRARRGSRLSVITVVCVVVAATL